MKNILKKLFSTSKEGTSKEVVLFNQIKELRDFRDVGETFEYLGIKMAVTSHYIYMGYGILCPLLQANYVDNNGIVQSASFYYGELPTLIKQNVGKRLRMF